MHDQVMAASSCVDEGRRLEAAVLGHLLDIYPGQIRIGELVRELSGGTDEARWRVRVEDAVRELRGAGLLFSSEAAVLPTRAAVRAAEVLVELA